MLPLIKRFQTSLMRSADFRSNSGSVGLSSETIIMMSGWVSRTCSSFISWFPVWVAQLVYPNRVNRSLARVFSPRALLAVTLMYRAERV